tara:strand:- start:849 stop:1298 length:450 start_codon:yes stop_codon:yes gene_type:complete
METTNEKVYKEIREILEKNRDAEKGYAKAADKAESTVLKSYFTKKSNDRRAFNTKLIGEIQTAYTDFDPNGSFAGNIHRVWMDVKALFSMDDDEAMLEEAIRGDKAAIDEYDDVLDYANLPTGLRFLLSEQREKIEREVANIKTLEDLM